MSQFVKYLNFFDVFACVELTSLDILAPGLGNNISSIRASMF